MAEENANVVISADTSQYSTSVAQASAQTNQFAASVDSLSAKLDGLTKRAGKKLALFGAADLAAMAAFTKMAANQEQQLESLDAAFVGTTKNIGAYTRSINQMARDIPVATSEIIQLVTQLNKMGIQSAQSAESMSRTFLKLSAATSENVNGLTQGMVMLNKQMGTLGSGSGAIQGFSNSLLSVSKASGSSAQGILDFSQSIAPFARTAGIGEKALLGVSAAFSAAGQDGFYAANTFNSMIADITRSIKNGSPDLTKYSNLLGVTVDQFKGMDPTDRIVSIFEAINKQGPNAIRTLDLLGQDGIRAAKAIQGVTQSGDLRGMVGKAIGGYDTANAGSTLDKSAEAAWGGMNSQLDKMKNNFSQIGQAIGSGIVGPATTALGVFNSMLSTVNQIAQPIMAMGGVLATIVGGGALGGGLAGSALGTMGQVAMMAYALRSRPVRGLLGGFQSGLQAGSATGSTGMAARMDALRASGMMPGYQARIYDAARGFGVGVGGPSVAGTNYLGRALTAPLRLISWGARGTADFYGDSARMGEDRRPAFSRAGLVQNARISGVVATERVRLRRLGGNLEQQVASGAMTQAAANNLLKAQIELARSAATAAGTMTQLSVSGKEAAAALGQAAMANLRAGASNIGTLAGSAMGGLKSLVGGPMGVLLAGMGAWQIKSNFDETRKEAIPDAAKNPVAEYNAALGISTDKLMEFTAQVVNASRNYKTVNEALDDMTSAVRLANSTSTITSSVVNALPGNDPKAGLAYLRSIQGQMNPQNTQSIIADVLRKYPGQAGQDIVNQFMGNRRYGADQGDITSYVLGAQSGENGIGGGINSLIGRLSDSTKMISGSVAGNISTAANGVGANDPFKGQQVQASLLISSLAEITKQAGAGTLGNSVAAKQVSGLEETFFNGQDIGYSGEGNSGSPFGGNTSWAIAAAKYMGKDRKDLTTDDIKKWFKEKAIPDNKVLQDWYNAQISNGIDPFMEPEKAYTVSHSANDPIVQKINATTLGGIAKTSPGVQFALDQGFDSPKAQNDAVMSLMRGAMSAGGGNSQRTIAAFDELISAVNLSSDRLSQLGQAAWDAYKALSNIQRGGMSQGAGVSRALLDTTALINAPSTDANAGAQQTARQDRAQELAGVESYYKQYAQALYQFQKQITRSEEDYTRSRSRANQSFGMQMEYAEKDFYRQRLWNQKDFNKSMARAAEDAAKSVYNPWERVYSQLTAGAGNVAQNMEDQNRLIQDQVKNLKKAHSMGLSQQVIDQLDLANPMNAQQFQAILDDIANDPSVIERLNRAAKARAKASKALTQNDDNVSYRRALADFKIANDRSSVLFETSQARARKQFGISMQQMAEDHTRSMKRAKEDMNDYGRVIADNFSTAEKYIAGMAKKLGVSNNFVTTMAKTLSENPALRKMLEDGTYGMTDDGDTGTSSNPGTRSKTWDDGTGRTGNSLKAPSITTSSSSSRVSNSNNHTSNSNNRYVTYETKYELKDTVITSSDPDKLARDLQQMARKNALTKARHIKP